MFKQLILLLALVFLLGWLSNTFYSDLAIVRAEQLVPEPRTGEVPFLPASGTIIANPEPVPPFARGTASERPSPADRLKPENVHVTDYRVVIDGIPGHRFETAIFTDTNSMDNFLDEGTQAIQVVPRSEKDILVGDVISYDSGRYGIIIHRVISIGYDDEGWYAIAKGDNNPAPDPIKVRFGMVRRVLVGVLY